MYSSQLFDEPCLAARLRYVSRVVLSVYDDALRDTGVTVAQLDLLATLAIRTPPTRPMDLSRELAMDRSTVTRNLARLQALGLTTTRPGPSGREHTIVLTTAGHEAIDRATPHWSAAQAAVKEMLGPSGVHALEQLYDHTITATHPAAVPQPKEK